MKAIRVALILVVIAALSGCRYESTCWAEGTNKVIYHASGFGLSGKCPESRGDGWRLIPGESSPVRAHCKCKWG